MDSTKSNNLQHRTTRANRVACSIAARNLNQSTTPAQCLRGRFFLPPGPIPRTTPERILMLVLSRFPDQIIRIGENVMIKVVSIQGDKVRLGIEAPKDIEVHRQEVWLKLYGENEPDQGPSDSAA